MSKRLSINISPSNFQMKPICQYFPCQNFALATYMVDVNVMNLTDDQFDDILDQVYVSKLLADNSSEDICAAYMAASFEVYS